MARRGARSLTSTGPDTGQTGSGDGDRDRGVPRPRPQEEWIDGGVVGDGSDGESYRHAPVRRRSKGDRLPADVAKELARSTAPAYAERDATRLEDGARAYRRERYADARRIVEPIARRAPDVAAVRELHGLCLYRLGRWKKAVAELEAAERLAGSLEHHPILADCHRALGHDAEVRRLWEELRHGPAAPAVVVEGRIVTATAMADAGDIAGAITLLEQGPVAVRKPREHHLRLWYALAALHERAGDVARARHLLRKLLDAAPDFADASDRYRSLR